MKKFTLLITSIFIISACSDNQNQFKQVKHQPSLVEYVWIKLDQTFNEDNLSMLINSWNAMIDEMPCVV